MPIPILPKPPPLPPLEFQEKVLPPIVTFTVAPLAADSWIVSVLTTVPADAVNPPPFLL